MLFVGGAMNGLEVNVLPGQRSYAGRVGGELSYYSRRALLDYGTQRGRQAMVETNLPDAQANTLVMEILLSRWVAGGTDDERA